MSEQRAQRKAHRGRRWIIDFILIVIFYIAVFVFIFMTGCKSNRPYVKTKSGWNTKEQKKRIRKQKENRPEYRITYIGGRMVPVTDLDLTNK